MIKKLLTLKDEFIINSSVDLISKKLYAFNLFNIEEVNNHEYKVSSKISLGIGVINNMISSPISVFVTIVELEQNKSKAILATGLRIDLMLIIILSLIVFFTLLFYQIIKKEEIPFWLNLIIFPIAPIWFRFIYRIQEKNLIRSIKGIFKN